VTPNPSIEGVRLFFLFVPCRRTLQAQPLVRRGHWLGMQKMVPFLGWVVACGKLCSASFLWGAQKSSKFILPKYFW
jgi:hypothetical protein